MHRRHIIVFLVLLFILIGTSACRELTEQEIRERNEARWTQLPDETKVEHRRMAMYASVFWFHFDHDLAHGSRHLRGIARSGMRTVEFAVSREDAEAGDESTFYFWPSDITVDILYVLNHVLNEEVDDWDSQSLSYPITMEDLVERWEEVIDLWTDLGFILPSARLIYPDAYWALQDAKDNDD